MQNSNRINNIPVTLVSNEEIAPACFRMVLSGHLDNILLNPGQFIMLRVGKGYDPLLRRPFAAYKFKGPEGLFLEIFYKVVGHGTRMMSHMCPNQELELLGPLGKGFRVPAGINTAFVVAGGMGIVPLRGLIYHLVNAKTEKIYVFMGTKSAAHLLFQEVFQEINISLQVATEDGSAGYHGLVTELFGQLLDTYYPMNKEGNMCFACGPLPMLKAVTRITSQYQLPCQVSLESRMACGIGACLGCVVKLRSQDYSDSGSTEYGRVCLEGPVFDAQAIAW